MFSSFPTVDFVLQVQSNPTFTTKVVFLPSSLSEINEFFPDTQPQQGHWIVMGSTRVFSVYCSIICNLTNEQRVKFVLITV